MKENQSLEDLYDEAADDLNDLKLYKKRKLITSVIRWCLTFVLYYTFFDVSWVRWSLVIVVPLALYNLYMITFGFNKVLNRFEDIKDRIEQEGKE